MNRIGIALMGLVVCVPAVCPAGSDDVASSVQLTLPREFYAVPGVAMSLFYDNVVLTQTPEAYGFDVTCAIGKAEKRRWTVTPQAADVGRHELSVTVTGPEGKLLARGSTVLQVVPADAGAGREMRLLIVGDSLTHATQYPNEIARLLSLPSNPRWLMLGTHRPQQAQEGVAHEGYGGWTWSRFVSHYEPNPDGTYRKRSSPFVYLNENEEGKPRLNVERYLQDECDGRSPDFVIFMLGINDCFGAPPDDPAGIDARIDGMFEQADILLAAFRKAAPDAQIGICLTTPPNSREAAFQANYKGRYHRWGWKRIQHRLVQRQLDEFDSRQRSNIFVVPTQLNLDPTGGYPADNSVHPNSTGYQQIGASIYAWLKWRLAESGH